MGAAALLLALFVSSALATCPDGTIFDARFNKCYKFITQPASFLLAEKTCESIGGSLVTVSNAFENTFISGIAAYNESTIQFWIGMNLLYYDQWTWVNGDSSSFRHWASGQPTSGPQGGAIQVVDTLWTTAQYNTILPYMCQIDPNAAPGNSCTTPSVPLTTALPATAAPGPCPNGHCPDANYTLNPDNCQCYKYTHYYGSYNESVQICSNDSATLPIIRSQSEDNFVGQFMNGWSNYIWLGLQCTSNSTANCRWQDGSPLQGYNHFYPNNPNGSPPVMKETVNNGFWFSEPFSDTNGCLCQKNGIP